MQHIDEEIDKLTNSIENAFTGERFMTDVLPVESADLKRDNGIFDWEREIENTSHLVFKLITRGNERIIQGLASIYDGGDHIFLNLIESASFNRGEGKQYLGVAGNLFAFACKYSFDIGYQGFVVFDSKTALKKHYEQILGAKTLFGNRMFIETGEAEQLIKQYYNE